MSDDMEWEASMMMRRMFLTGTVVGTAALHLAMAARPAMAAGKFAVTRSNAEWRKLLTAQQYSVLRQEGTEYPNSSPLLHENRKGRFACVGCDQSLFSSTTKFESGTGWPSFWAPIDNAVVTARDTSAGMVRDAVSCSRCGGHLGHVFNDGPKPTGLRYCMNGVAMTFHAAAA